MIKWEFQPKPSAGFPEAAFCPSLDLAVSSANQSDISEPGDSP